MLRPWWLVSGTLAVIKFLKVYVFLSFLSSLPGAVSVSEALAPRVASRVCLETSGAKPKLGCPKDNWHG